MRTSSLVFLLIFAGAITTAKRHRQSRCEPASCEATEVRTDDHAEQSSRVRSVRALERELRDAQTDLRATEKSIRGMEQSLRSLQDLVQRSRHASSGRSSRREDSIESMRRLTYETMRAELTEITRGHQQLLAQADQLRGVQAALKARIELARAGIVTKFDEPLATPSRTRTERQSPLDALGDSEPEIVRPIY